MLYVPLITMLDQMTEGRMEKDDHAVFVKKIVDAAMSCGIRITERKAQAEYFTATVRKALPLKGGTEQAQKNRDELLSHLYLAIDHVFNVEPVKLSYSDALLFRREITDNIPVMAHIDSVTWNRIFIVIDTWRMSTTIADITWQAIADHLGVLNHDERQMIRGAYYEHVHPYKAVTSKDMVHVRYCKANIENMLTHKWGLETVFLAEHDADLAELGDFDVYAITEQYDRYHGKVAVRAFRQKVLCYKLNKRPVLFIKGQTDWIGPNDLEHLRYTEGLYTADMPTMKSEYKFIDGFPSNIPAGEYSVTVDEVKIVDGKLVTSLKDLRPIASKFEDKVTAPEGTFDDDSMVKAANSIYRAGGWIGKPTRVSDVEPRIQELTPAQRAAAEQALKEMTKHVEEPRSQRFSCAGPNMSNIPKSDVPSKLFVKLDENGMVCGSGITLNEPDIIVTPEFKGAVGYEVRRQLRELGISVDSERDKSNGVDTLNSNTDAEQAKLRQDTAAVDNTVADLDQLNRNDGNSEKYTNITVRAVDDDAGIRLDVFVGGRQVILDKAILEAVHKNGDFTVKRTKMLRAEDVHKQILAEAAKERESYKTKPAPVHVLTESDVDDVLNKYFTRYMNIVVGTIIAAIALSMILRYYNFI